MSVYTDEAQWLLRIESLAAGGLVGRWMGQLSPEDLSALLGDNREPFRRAWGKHTCTFTSEYRHWIWRFKEVVRGEVLPWYVLTGLRGTSIEIHCGIPYPMRLEIAKIVLSAARGEGR